MSISQTIEKDKNQYYTELKKAQTTLEIDSWLLYFSQLLIDAQQNTIDVLNFSVKKTQFWDTYKTLLNARQEKAINKMLDAGKDGFVGGMTAKKYTSITKASKATATRDLQELVENKILK
jgi:Fic family protein